MQRRGSPLRRIPGRLLRRGDIQAGPSLMSSIPHAEDLRKGLWAERQLNIVGSLSSLDPSHANSDPRFIALWLCDRG